MTPSRARSIVAAARRIDLAVKSDVSLIKRAGTGWVDEAWEYWDSVPEVKFAGRFLAHCMGRLRLYPGVVIDPDEPPMFVGDAADAARLANPADAIPQDIADAAVEELARVANQREGQAGLLRSWGVNLFIPGDSYLLGEDLGSGEDWQVYSASAIQPIGGRTRQGADGEQVEVIGVKEAPDDTPREIAPDAVLIRVWRRHDRWAKWSDSPMRSLLDVCEELLIWARVFRSIARTRNSNGFLLVPSELDFEEPFRPGVEDDDVDEGGPEEMTKLERDMLDSQLKPLEDESSPTSVAPHLIRGKAEFLKEFRHVAVDRKIDEFVTTRLAELVQRFARGTDLPPEVILGIADTNHWGSWQIEDATYKTAVEPTAEIPAWGLADAWLRGALTDRFADGITGVVPAETERQIRRVVVGIDPAALVSRPNQAQDTKDAYDKVLIGSSGARKRLGISDGDKPSEDEWLRRQVEKFGTYDAAMTAQILAKLGVGTLTPASPGTVRGEPGTPPSPPPAEQDQPTPENERPEDQAPVAAAAGRWSNRLGERLASIDARLRMTVQVAAGDALEKALTRAGNRLRARAQGDPQLARQVNRLDPATVGHVVGEEQAAALGDTSELLDGAFDQLAGRWDSFVAGGQAEVEQTIMGEAIDPGDGESTAAEYESGADGRRAAGWALLLGALMSIANDRLWRPDSPTAIGEFDASVPISVGPVRDALAVAGGDPPGAAAGGVATGRAAISAMLRLGNMVQGWEWRVGAPTRPFEPHQDLDGVVFATFDDAQLANTDSWPPHGFYFPGDHAGCQCQAVPIMVPADELAGPVDEVAPEEDVEA